MILWSHPYVRAHVCVCVCDVCVCIHLTACALCIPACLLVKGIYETSKWNERKINQNYFI